MPDEPINARASVAALRAQAEEDRQRDGDTIMAVQLAKLADLLDALLDECDVRETRTARRRKHSKLRGKGHA